MDNDRLLNFTGIILFGIWVLTLIEEYPYFGSYNFLWFCRLSFLFLAIACLTKDGRWLMTFIAVGLLPELLWTIDFIFEASGSSFIGTTSFMLEYGQTKLQFALGLLHMLLIPAALGISRRIKVNRSGRWHILSIAAIALPLSYFLSGINVDINCVHNLCYPQDLGIGIWALAAMAGYMLICAFIIEPAVRRFLGRKTSDRIVSVAIWLLVIAAAIASAAGTIAYSQSPHYTCASTSAFTCERFFMDRESGMPWMQYRVESGKECEIEIMIDGELLSKFKVRTPEDGRMSIYLPQFDRGIREASGNAECS